MSKMWNLIKPRYTVRHTSQILFNNKIFHILKKNTIVCFIAPTFT